jgi:hypothetical protein
LGLGSSSGSGSIRGRNGFDGMEQGCRRQWAGDYPNSANHKGQLSRERPAPRRVSGDRPRHWVQ